MATRQYIGARYVPKFFEGVGGSTEWINGVQYEPLTIVTHLGNSYTSKKPVPVGVDILNTEYWVNTGNYNAQVEEYREEVEDIKSITDVINNFENKKVLIIGDSIGDTGIARFQPNYVTHLTSKLTALGATVTNNSVGGRAIASGVTGTTGGIAEAISGISDTYDYIIVELGINDWACGSTRAQVTAGLGAFNSWIISSQPNAKVFFVTPLSHPIDNTKVPVDYYRSMILETCTSMRYNVIDMFAKSSPYSGVFAGSVSRWTADGDGVHPTPAFAPYYADIVFKSLLYNNNDINLLTITGFTISDVTLFNVGYYRGDGTIRLMGTNNNSYTPNANTVLLGTLPNFCKPFTNVTRTVYCASSGQSYTATILIRDDGRVFGVFNNLIAYNDLYIDITYDSLNHTFVNS